MSENACFFQLLSTIKVNPVDKMKRSTYLGIILHVKQKAFPSLGVFTCFLILGKSKMGAKMATMFGDVTDLQQRHHP